MAKLEVTKNDICVKFYEVKTIEGEASVTIRKQKQIFLYDFEMEVYFEANGAGDQCKGKVKIHEFNQDDDEVVFEITQEKPSDFVSKVKKIIANDLNELTLKTFQSLNKAMREKDADDIKLKKDQMERENAKKAVEEAKKQTGEQKDKIFDEAKKKEEEFKKSQAEAAKLNQVPLKANADKINTVAGQGSVWNNNSYHWEEKSVAKWSEETLKKCFSLFYFKHDKATLKITEVKDLKGESSVSIRKSKKIVTYEYNAKLCWKCDMGDEKNEKVIGSIEGEFELPEISNDVIDDGEEWEIRCSILKGDESLR